MPLAPGTHLGPYEITGPLGAGGMGEVYRATDTKLRREVALKVLPSLFSSDTERMARFEREAQVLASLNHPNIATIHGLEESSGPRALVMELVEGPTLAERIARGPISLSEALPIARQIAEGLEYAHEKGVVHRDLKPANIKLTPEGQVKILDFGLAKALADENREADIANSPTLTGGMTNAGVILGTAAYMSPEQARGRAVDKRTDIWAFGCVLFELLSGKRAFSGETASDTIAKVLERDPNWSALPIETTGNIRRVLRWCLEKDSKRRVRDVGDVRIQLEEPEPDEAPQTRPSRLALGLFALGGAVAAATLGLALRGIMPRTGQQKEVTQFTIQFPRDTGESLDISPATAVAVSPDGKNIVCVVRSGLRTQIYLRPMSQLDARAIPGTESAMGPFFSPDGQSVGFFANGELRKVSLSDGASATISRADVSRGAGSDGNIVFADPRFGLLRVSSSGGNPQPLAALGQA